MKGIHINWSRPFFQKNDSIPYYISDFNLLVNIVSALKWRKYNGSIKLYADKIAADYYRSLGLDIIYDGGIDDSLDEHIPASLDTYMFWAAAKLYALKMESAPLIIIDLDFVVWNDISHILKGKELCVSHKEFLHEEAYKDRKNFYLSPDYKIDEAWDWNQLPCNTALTYFGDETFKNYYVNESIKFMEENSNIPASYKHNNIYMVFAEQRILSMCAKKINIKPYCFLSNTNPPRWNNNYTHTWGMKNTISNYPDINYEACQKAIKYILEDFPEMLNVLKHSGRFDIYL